MFSIKVGRGVLDKRHVTGVHAVFGQFYRCSCFPGLCKCTGFHKSSRVVPGGYAFLICHP